MESNFKILLVEDSKAFREAVKQLLGVYNDVDEADGLTSARTKLQFNSYDVVILDKGLEDGDGFELIPEIKSLCPNTVIIVLTSESDYTVVKQCMDMGVDDYVVKTSTSVPDLLVRIPIAVSRAASLRKLKNLEDQVKEAFKYEIVGKHKTTIELRENILSLRGTKAHVLITGESGTGKELVARRLNAVEDASKRPFVVINCGALPENLIESELFGHRKGSFTGATQDRIGKFELAHNGDIFLDEIAELPLQAQVKLLRVIQEGEVTRIGDSRVIKVNCRVITATNKNLEELVKEGKFREDLYYRLNVYKIKTTPLRERKEDISDLVRLYLLTIGGPDYKISRPAVKSLCQYSWPGNIREFRNIIERSVIFAKKRGSKTIDYEDIIIKEGSNNSSRLRKLEASFPTDVTELSPKKFKDFIRAVEKEYLSSAICLTKGNATKLSKLIGLSRSTMFKHLRECDVKYETNYEIENEYNLENQFLFIEKLPNPNNPMELQ